MKLIKDVFAQPNSGKKGTNVTNANGTIAGNKKGNTINFTKSQAKRITSKKAGPNGKGNIRKGGPNGK